MKYGSNRSSSSSSIRFAHSQLIRNHSSTVLYPGDFVDLNCSSFTASGEVAVEPRMDSPAHGSWPEPSIVQVVDGSVRLTNNLDLPIKLAKNQHVGNILPVISEDSLQVDSSYVPLIASIPSVCDSTPFSEKVSIDPGKQLSREDVDKFRCLNLKFDSVFDPNYTGYNDFSGVIRAKVNITSAPPPPQKARLPFYDQKNLVLLQQHSDELEEKGVLITPEYINAIVAHSF